MPGRRFAACALLTALILLPDYRQVPSSNAWEISVTDAPDRPGAVLALTVRLSGAPRSVGDAVESLGFGDGIGEPKVVEADTLVSRLGPGEVTRSAAAAANAWIAAHALAGVKLRYTTSEVIVAVQEGSVADASGLVEGQRIDWLPERVLGSGGPDASAPRRALEGADTVRIRETGVARPPLQVRRRLDGLSVGLAAALAYLDQIRPGGVTGGRVVAATGTVDPTGWVGEISNVELKTRAAVAAGADVLFVPRENLHDACAAADGALTVIAVRHLRVAEEWLEHEGEGIPCPEA